MIYGYDSRAINEFGLKQMREISVSVSPEVLRELAGFLSDAADELEGAVSDHWHRHASDDLQRKVGCDLIILNRKPEVRTRR